MNLDTIKVLSIAIATVFLLSTLGSIITNSPTGAKTLKISVNPFQVWNRIQKVSTIVFKQLTSLPNE